MGYGPFVEVFAPSTTPLTSVSYLGNDLTVKAVTLTTDSNGVVGALNPYSTGANGQPGFVDAPSSFKAGDTMCVVSLPFGSYTPGQPAITLTAQFANKTVETVDQSSGTGPRLSSRRPGVPVWQ
ncbi:hypothetical protein RAA17_10425 [Komagataeibacter rhaeticus]|nr:hypothetical protein [Komagataeibacter rhaeticus]